MSYLKKTDAEILETVKQLRLAYTLKRTLRYATERDFSKHNESVAEHVFALCFLLNFFLPLEEVEGEIATEGEKIDRATVYDMLVFHDFGEIIHGDVPYHLKTKELEAREREDAKQVFGVLPADVGAFGSERVREFEERQTKEAKFAYALDVIEPLFELYDPVNELSMKRLQFRAEMSIGKKRKGTEGFPVMRRFVEVLHADMVGRGVFWE